ncbi:MAG: PEGA domain-containing protein [Nitrospirae bacterium]|nr:PEGA domain-containing protein [Nitrospirota bacterium]
MKKVIAVLLLVVNCMGCGTLFNGTTKNVGISSSPSGAQVIVDGRSYITPAQVGLKRNQTYAITVQKEGYEPAGATVQRSVSGWIWADVVSMLAGGAGLLGLIVDFVDGGAYDLEPDNVNVNLQKK